MGRVGVEVVGGGGVGACGTGGCQPPGVVGAGWGAQLAWVLSPSLCPGGRAPEVMHRRMQQWQRRAERKGGPGDPHPSQGITWEALVRGSGGRGRAGGSGRAGTAGCRKREAAEGRHAMQPCTGLGQAVQHAETPPNPAKQRPPHPTLQAGGSGAQPRSTVATTTPGQARSPGCGTVHRGPACSPHGHRDSVPGTGTPGQRPGAVPGCARLGESRSRSTKPQEAAGSGDAPSCSPPGISSATAVQKPRTQGNRTAGWRHSP